MTTLYEWAGGEPSISRLIDACDDRVDPDHLPGVFPGGMHADDRDLGIALVQRVRVAS